MKYDVAFLLAFAIVMIFAIEGALGADRPATERGMVWFTTERGPVMGPNAATERIIQWEMDDAKQRIDAWERMIHSAQAKVPRQP